MKHILHYGLVAFCVFSASAVFSATNVRPEISGTPQRNILPDEAYSFQPSASDPDGDPLTFLIKKKPGWATFDEQTGALTGTPTNADRGAYKSIRIGARDGKKTTWLQGFRIDVLNTPPVIEGIPETVVQAGEEYSFQATASDIDGDILTFQIKKKPSWANFNETTGILSGTPTSDDRKNYGGIRIGVSDGFKTVWQKAFRLKVNNNLPVISGVPGTEVALGQEYSFTPDTSDVDGDVLRFTIKKKPAWAKFDKTTGTLSGTPSKQRFVDKTFNNIVITAIDKRNGRAALPEFAVRVVNETFYEPPSLSGLPDTQVMVGDKYRFLPIVKYTGDGSLTFSINNKPFWATFDQATGELSGVPVAGDAGISPDIAISVQDSDGKAGNLTPFQLEVANSAASRAEAHRLLTQASFGSTPASVQAIMEQGVTAWVDEQLAMLSAYDSSADAHLTHLERTIQIAQTVEPNTNWYESTVFNQQTFSGHVNTYHMATWMENALGHPVNPHGDDQLRQRVAYALSQLLVVSNKESPLDRRGEALAFYYDILARNAFGNYRTLLDEMTRSPAMGVYLSHQGNRKTNLAASTSPDENFARELIQLFSVGLYELNLDGSPNRDGNPNTYPDVGSDYIPAYTQEDVVEMAKVMTGWDLVGNNRYGRSGRKHGDYTTFMEFTPSEHEDEVAEGGDGQVTIMGQTFALNAGVDGSGLDAALDILFQHPNVGPFVSRNLIRRLVTSNPSSAYVARVASVFNNNGEGIRGDLKSVVRSILLDDEARNMNTAQQAHFGKAKEPLLALTQFLRAFDIRPLDGWKKGLVNGVYWYRSPQQAFGQAALRSPSVFNFYSDDFVPSDEYFAQNSLVAPELQIQSDQMLVDLNNKIYSFINTYEENNITQIRRTSLSNYAARKGGGREALLISFDDELAVYEQALDGDSNGDFANMELINPATGLSYKEGAVGALLEHLDKKLLGGTMQAEYHAALKHYLVSAAGSQNKNNFREAWQNIKDAVRFIVTTSQFMVQK